MTSTTEPIQKKVVVIGGGIAGLAACVALRKKDKYVDILLVEPKQYFQVPWTSYRAIFDAKMREASIFDLEPWCTKHNVTHLETTVTRLTETSAQLGNGQVITDFAAAAICVGAVCKWPSLGRCHAIETTRLNGKTKTKPNASKGNVLTRQERIAQLEQDGERLLNAGSVLVVGGGLIGVETAGDLAYFAAKEEKILEVTLVHSGKTLIPEFPERASNMVLKKLTKLGVNVILDDKVVPSKNKNKTGNNKKSKASSSSPTTTFHLQNSDQDISANQVIWTTGLTAQNHFMLDPKYLTKKGGWIKVNENFVLTHCDNGRLFAFGDCCDLLPNAGNQVLGAMPVIGHNLKVSVDSFMIGGENDGENSSTPANKRNKLNKSMLQPELYIATIGKKDGVALTPFGATGLGLPRLKNKTQFLMKPKNALGLV
ncbi:FAD-dependent pyridine nucleotide-disulfide oxidoreductase [Nitzschia inconspicua]|uniref:FAD-dependent pyridine nucleotide-disulfide oxidoreductase n=1 Tax=Nitzschia inconspicua TaxID=303405 RepID=A0A9K3K8G2_9STRA|nr:FAD-dependent pyridine nucleotide-disulfide oxidoreductase [Nitzschia inconspicua]KAG7374902.1 FAD-dependent pyridine nucleotide-disulfide oxidoreductase [Nitzschia inconspicua]